MYKEPLNDARVVDHLKFRRVSKMQEEWRERLSIYAR